MTEVDERSLLQDRQFTDLSQCNAWLHSNLAEYSAVERLTNVHGNPVLLAFTVEEIKDKYLRAYRPRICDSVVQACRWRHFYLPARTPFRKRHDRRPVCLAFFEPHYSRLLNEKNRTTGLTIKPWPGW